MRRRTFLGGLAAAAAGAATVKGSVLVHEHILVDFVGAAEVSRARYDGDEVFRVALPKLKEIGALGCRRLQECTPNFLGRDPRLLRRLQEASGVELWTNTGLYAARDFIFLPAYAKTESAEQLAKRFIGEARQGVEGMKPRFIKIGVDKGPLPELSRKLVRAAAIACRETGLPVAAHTGDGKAALEELEILVGERCAPSKFVWVHAQNEKDPEVHAKVARAGAWVEFDGISPQGLEHHLRCVRQMAERDLLGRTLISQDAGWYHVGEAGGGNFGGFAFLYTDFVPRLESGWAERLLVANPVAAFG